MAGISVHIIRGGSFTKYLRDAFRYCNRSHSCSLHLRIETRRYEKIPRNERICTFCSSNKIEDDNLFLLVCKACSKIKDVFFSKIELKLLPDFESLSHDTLLAYL